MYPVVVSLVLFLALSRCGGPSKPIETVSFWHPLATDIVVAARAGDDAVSCQAFRKTLPATFEQGFVTVPEDWANPASPKIQIFYYWNAKADKSQAPIVFYNGGPTYSSHGTYAVMKDRIVKGNLPFVFLDQRGTGCSTGYPTAITTENAQRLAHYGSAAIVRDSEVVRAKLLGDTAKWKAYGQSAGGWMVQRYIELAPRSLHTAYAHGAAFSQDSVHEYLFRLRAQKRIADLYFKKYPDDRKLVENARRRVPAEMCFTDGTTRICGPSVIDSFIITLAFQDNWANVHDWLLASDSPDETYFKSWVRDVAVNFFYGSFISPHGFANSAIATVETTLVNEEVVCDTVERLLEKEGEKPKEWLFNECRMTNDMEQKWNDVMAAITKREPYRIGDVHKRLNEFPDLKFFLYAGLLDPLVPSESFKDTVTRLGGRVTFHEFRDSGHEGFHSEDKVWDDLKMQ